MLGRAHIDVVLRELSQLIERLQFNQAKFAALLVTQMKVRRGVSVHRHCLIHPLELRLQLRHQLDLRVEPSHVADCLLKVYLRRTVTVHDDSKFVLGLDAELLQHKLSLLYFLCLLAVVED